jgi:glycine/D-amino acid oxidase-like deaminating enzyme
MSGVGSAVDGAITSAPPNEPVWARVAIPARPALEGEVAADVCVVGLGGSGLAAILALQEMGRTVVGIDAGTVAGGAAGRNGGFLLAGIAAFHHDAVRAHGRDRARALYAATLAEMDRIAAQAPDAVRRAGSLRIARAPGEAEDCAAQREAMRADGFAVEPYAGPEGVGLCFPADGTFQPRLRARRLAERAEACGARLFEASPAVEVGGDAVRTPRGRVRCGAVIVAVDGRLEALLPETADRVRTARLQMLATAPTAEVRLPRPVYARWGYEYWQQLEDGTVTLGGFRDRGGEAEWTHDATPSPTVQGELERFLREELGIRAPITHRWAASVGYAAGGLPLLDEVRPGVWALGGYSGTGNVVGALCGRAAAEMVVRGTSDTGDLVRGR